MVASMKKSGKICRWTALVLLLALGGFLVWIWEPWNAITRDNFRRIHRGMPMEEVEAILGEPSSTQNQGRVRKWRDSDGNWIIVLFENNLVTMHKCDFGDEHPGRKRSFRGRVRDWLGWGGRPFK
jgi:hypothetical protein